MAKIRELKDDMDQFGSHAEFSNFLKTNPVPLNLKLRIKHLTHRPADWNDDLFGEFPKDGLLCVFAHYPSSNKSITKPENDKQVSIFFSNQPNQKLSLKFELKQVFGWYCFSTSPDTCNCFMSTGMHTMAHVILLLCPYWKEMVQKLRLPFRLLDNIKKNILISSRDVLIVESCSIYFLVKTLKMF